MDDANAVKLAIGEDYFFFEDERHVRRGFHPEGRMWQGHVETGVNAAMCGADQSRDYIALKAPQVV